MATSKSFKVPSIIAQDLSIIMTLIDTPESVQENRNMVRGQKRKGSPNIIPRTAPISEHDVASSDGGDDAESEDEVEAEIIAGPESSEKPRSSTSSDSESSTDSDVSSSSSSLKKDTRKRAPYTIMDGDFDEDGLMAVTTYVPSAHELPPTAIPVPPLPDPSTLPQDPLQLAGEIATVLPDSVIVRGGLSGLVNTQEQRDAVLDEGSLLVLEDRTPLGYVFETFGPTSLPHYIVRVKRVEETRIKTEDPQPEISFLGIGPHAVTGSDISSKTIASPFSGLNPTQLLVGQTIYHIPPLSNFVYPSALARLKGSDASNIHDEEPAEHELEFSDDEAEAAQKRTRNRRGSRTPSVSRFEENENMSTFDDDVESFYGTPPHEFDDSSHLDYGGTSVKLEPSSQDSSVSSNFQDPAIRDALLHVRNSRKPKMSSALTNPSVAGSSQNRDLNGGNHGRGGGRDRGRERNIKGQARGRGRGRGGHHQAPPDLGSGQDHGTSSFSFEEYDPHMPRPPSPTSLAIARATGQWKDGTPFPYSGVDRSGNAGSNEYQYQLPFAPGINQPYGFVQRVDTHTQHPTMDHETVPYGVAPHINPRFAHSFGFPNLSVGETLTSISNNDKQAGSVVDSEPKLEP